MKLLKPDIYQKDIYTINYDNLKNKGIKNLLFDIDNTISSTKNKIPSKELHILFNSLKEKDFNIFIITNALKKRATTFGEMLNVKTYHFAMKPSPKMYLKLIKENKLNIKETAAIGDQIYTDIKGANRLNITSILVDPIAKREFITTKFNRIRENKLIKKTNIIKRGEYYE